MKSKRFTPILTKGRGFCMNLVLTLEKGSKIQEKAYFICEVPLREKRAFFLYGTCGRKTQNLDINRRARTEMSHCKCSGLG